MTIQLKLLRLAALALLKIERAVCRVSRRVGEYTLDVADAQYEHEFNEAVCEAEFNENFGFHGVTWDDVADIDNKNTDAYYALAEELELLGYAQ